MKVIRELLSYLSLIARGEEIANIIKSFVGENYSNNAALYRTNMEARSLVDTFTRRKIPFVLLDKGYNFFRTFYM